MIRFQRQLQWFSGQLDVAPFLCLFFLLLILLALLTHLAPVPGVRIDLPATSLHEEASGVDWLVVVADKEGRLFFNQQMVSEEILESELTSRASNALSSVELVLQADAEIRLGQLTRFYALSRRAGITNLKFQTRPVSQLPTASPGLR